MEKEKYDRKEFLKAVSSIGKGVCACAALGALGNVYACDNSTDTTPPKTTTTTNSNDRAVKRMQFTEKWVPRFFAAFAQNVERSVAEKVMMENGKSCYTAWVRETNQQPQAVDFEQWKQWIRANYQGDGLRIDGNVIYYQYEVAAETGQTSTENQCLCMLVENKPSGMNPIYCHCSVGYVKEQHRLLFQNKRVDVELLDSVLRGGRRCKFKITVT